MVAGRLSLPDHAPARLLAVPDSPARSPPPYGRQHVPPDAEEVRYVAKNAKKPGRSVLEKRKAKQEKRAARSVTERKRDRLARTAG